MTDLRPGLRIFWSFAWRVLVVGVPFKVVLFAGHDWVWTEFLMRRADAFLSVSGGGFARMVVAAAVPAGAVYRLNDPWLAWLVALVVMVPVVELWAAYAALRRHGVIERRRGGHTTGDIGDDLT